MRRLIVLCLASIVLATVMGPASADSPKVRTDPNDSTVNPDIRSVTTDLSTSTVFLKISAWQRVSYHNFRTEYMLYLDTFGDAGFDRWVEVVRSEYNGKPGLVCIVEDLATYALIGVRPVTRPDRWSVSCHLPREWFGHIDRAVRFFAQVRNIGSRRTDRAPDRGLYIWL